MDDLKTQQESGLTNINVYYHARDQACTKMRDDIDVQVYKQVKDRMYGHVWELVCANVFDHICNEFMYNG